MMQYSVQPRDQIFVKGYGFFFFAKNISRNIGENISKNLGGKYSQKRLYHAKKSATDKHKTSSKKVIQKTPEETGDLNGNEIANKTTAVPNNSQQNNSETVTNQNYKIMYKIMFGIIEKCLWDY